MLMRIDLDPHECSRLVTLAYLLEATFPKDQCTSRYDDIGPNQRFEDFMVSAVNSTRFFFELAERINSAQGQPQVIYDLAYQALMNGTRQRTGKMVNHGLLEALLPAAVSRWVYATSADTALSEVPTVLRRSSGEDVHWVAAMRREVYTRSNKPFKQNYPFHESGESVYAHYESHREIAHEVSHQFVGELMEGMPLTRIILETLEQDQGSLPGRINKGFRKAKEKTILPFGAVADFTAVALFLYLSDRPDVEVIDLKIPCP